MNSPENKVTFTVKETSQSLDYWLSRPHITPELREELSDASVLLVPIESFRGESGPFFTDGTSTLLLFLQDNLPSLKVDICADDETYRELALNFDWLDLGKFVVEHFGAPTFLLGLQRYLDRRPQSQDTGVKCRVIVRQDSDGTRYVEADYEGPANELRSTFEPFLRDLSTPIELPPGSSSPSLPPAGAQSNDEDLEARNSDDSSSPAS